jgi:hypothetical protein
MNPTREPSKKYGEFTDELAKKARNFSEFKSLLGAAIGRAGFSIHRRPGSRHFFYVVKKETGKELESFCESSRIQAMHYVAMHYIV